MGVEGAGGEVDDVVEKDLRNTSISLIGDNNTHFFMATFQSLAPNWNELVFRALDS